MVPEEAAENGYGTMSYINSFQLFVSFTVVVIFAAISDEALNKLEEWAHAAGFQELFQRVYRELMIMGIASFAIQIMSSSSGGGFGSWEYAYYFSDNMIFLISSFFCLQGIGVMAMSLVEAKSWDRASKIPTEELLMDVENEIRNKTFSWKKLWYPFNTTRNQVEFRAFKMLFTKVYKINCDGGVFKFGYFLRLSHQRNVISAIDITPMKWLTVVVLVGLISLYYEFDIYDCKNSKCNEAFAVYSFIVFGFVVVIAAAILCRVARMYEIRLLKLVGIHDVDDYDIYLQSEAQIIAAMQKALVDAHVVLDVLSQLQAETESQTTADINEKRYGDARNFFSTFFSIFRAERISPAVPSSKTSIWSTLSSPVRALSSPFKSQSFFSPSDSEDVDPNHVSRAYVHEPEITNENDLENPHPKDTDFENRVTEFQNSIKYEDGQIDSTDTVSVTNKNPSNDTAIRHRRRKSIFDVAVEKKVMESVVVKLKGGRHSPVKQTASLSVKSASQKTMPTDDKLFEKHKQFYRKELDRGAEYLKNFRSIFFRSQPEFFFNCVHMIMLCNSLYMAWWITTLIFYITNAEQADYAVVILSLITLLPPVLIFPLLTLLVRGTTIFKALMRLDPLVVIKALTKAEEMQGAIAALQQNIRIRYLFNFRFIHTFDISQCNVGYLVLPTEVK